ncbi:MAG: FAD/NAD(P)-binding protein [Streptosporangiaceae bacterium]|nr:FAD/NAD(P)-binding protein [Streptosporangiaceae bacterium]
MCPARYVVAGRRAETFDTVSLMLRPVADPIEPPRPGQFTMLYSFGAGEVPISVSGVGRGHELLQTIYSAGAITRALCAAAPGDIIGVRGPFGTGWPLCAAEGRDLLIIAGSIGLAPLRQAVLAALANRARYNRIALLVGARSPDRMLFARELDTWRRRGAEVTATVYAAHADWKGNVGPVTKFIGGTVADPAGTVAFVCCAEVVMRFAARELLARGVAAENILVSLERNMKCGAALCGHCQLGPLLLCRDGPVVNYADAAPLAAKQEL